MRILILNQAFYPDVVSTAQHASDLAIALMRAGHQVTVVCNSRAYDDPRLRFPNRETWSGINIVRVRSTGFGKNSKWRRAVDFATFMASCAYRLWSLPRFDVIVAMTSPPLISYIASLAVHGRAHSLVCWSMDLNPDEAIAAGWLRDESLTARFLSRLLVHSLRRADRIIALDRFMKKRIEQKGIPAEKVVLVPPWSHDDRVRFDPTGRNEFRAIHKLCDKFVVMYSGNHSPCHPLETLLQAAERLADRKEIVFCFVGGGSEFRKVQERARDRGMRNVLCIPYQPIERLSASLSAGDLHVVVMGNKYVGIVHPCKIYNVLAANRAFLYIGPQESHVQDIIHHAGRDAYASAHGDVDGVVTNIVLAMRQQEAASPMTVELAKRFAKESLVPQMIRVIEESKIVSSQTRLEPVSQP
jgi:glycosyltransferase involved in cell wall biosynthesis